MSLCEIAHDAVLIPLYDTIVLNEVFGGNGGYFVLIFLLNFGNKIREIVSFCGV